MDDLKPRGLKRKEVKALKKRGFNMGALKPDQVDDFMDEVFGMVFSDAHNEAIDDLPQADCSRLLNEIIDATTGKVPEEQEKNS